jgi:hypothetical protein
MRLALLSDRRDLLKRAMCAQPSVRGGTEALLLRPLDSAQAILLPHEQFVLRHRPVLPAWNQMLPWKGLLPAE